LNAPALRGKIAVVQRGGCPFTTKVMHVQAAGAIAVILVGLDNKERFSEVMQIAQGRLQLPVKACARLSANENMIRREHDHNRYFIALFLISTRRK
jgi:hypothetical protein